MFSDSGRDIKLCGDEGVDDHDVDDSGNHDDNIVALMTMMVTNAAVKMARSSKLQLMDDTNAQKGVGNPINH